MTIHIDLNNLTQAHIDECAPVIGSCFYKSPCIIGTLIPEDQREPLDEFTAGPDGLPNQDVTNLAEAGAVSFPEGQLREAQRLQNAFDHCEPEKLAELLAKRGLTWPTN